MLEQEAISDLARALRRFFVEAEDTRLARALAAWPEKSQIMTALDSSALPVLNYLQQASDCAPAGQRPLVELLEKASPGLSWQQTYSPDDFPQDFLDRYGWTILVGPQGPVPCASLLAGFLFLGPEIEYPRHHHSPEEFYRIVSGSSEWHLGEGDWSPRWPGDLIHNPPWQWHAMRVGAGAPLLLAFVFMAAEVEKSSFD